ncbi:uncharacterized protein C1orf64 homolog [Carlito syrichta]|uniref:Uncharacterized protein C1orf64 homolog n=1 Tax=Carlito syrichta TaxID=1868482 RepID=A0A1U7UNY4_CARSF|nr:uncharacterized protein C1orf64 homolog [Carlito syrichta]
MAPSEDPRDWRASLKVTGLETDPDTSTGEKLPCHQKSIPTAHMTFVIDCAHGKQLPMATSPVPPRIPSPNRGPVTPPMKIYIVFCGENQARPTQETLPARAMLPPCRGIVAPASFPVSPLCPQEVPDAKGRRLEAVSMRSSTWGTVKDSLKALSSCVCGQAD